LCLKIQFKSEFGQDHCEEWCKRIYAKFILKFLDILQVSTNFGSLPYFLRVGRRGGVLADGSAMARLRQGVAGDLEGATGKVPGKEEGAEAHQSGVPTVRQRNGVGRRSVGCGGVLQLEGDPGVRRRG
jgi:hypothetical protein